MHNRPNLADDRSSPTSFAKSLTMRPVFAGAFAVLVMLTNPASGQHVEAEAALAERVLGDPGAPVTIVAYESLSCPHCAAFHRDTFDDLKAKYIDSGDVYFIYRDFPLNGRAVRAAMLARCTSEQQYFGMLQILFRAQQQWLSAHDVDSELERLARMSGMNGDVFSECMANEELFDGVVASAQQGTQDFQVNSTPSFIINGTLYAGNRSLEEFSAIIDPLIPGD